MSLIPSHLRVAGALRDVFKEGYSHQHLRADLLAGLVVGLVAIPLSMALAIACGMPPQHGLATAIVAGGSIALLGGSRLQVSGPTAAFVVVLAPVVKSYGPGGLLIATLMAGAVLVIMALGGLGRLIRYIPYPVTVGFTAGIGIVIGGLQVKELASSLPSAVVGLLTLAVLVLWPRLVRRVPAPLVALTFGSLLAAGLSAWWPSWTVDTIATRFASQGGIPAGAPGFVLPWGLPGADGQPLVVDLDLLRALIGPAFAIAMLGAIESLLSAVVADGLAGTRHDPDGELLGQGIGNLLAPFFGGFAATGAIARTATNIRAGARSPIAAVVHALFVLLAIMTLAPALGYLPMPSLAAVLMMTAWNMSELPHALHTLRRAPRADSVVLLTCLVLTVAADMVVAVATGVVLASLLFMRRMAEVTDFRLITAPQNDERVGTAGMPDGVLVYQIAGPLFFGAAQRAMQQLDVIGDRYWAVVLDLADVPAIDATALANLESAVSRLARGRRWSCSAAPGPRWPRPWAGTASPSAGAMWPSAAA
ncbi:MAG: SulP family inorganic anion transporter [bacterium]